MTLNLINLPLYVFTSIIATRFLLFSLASFGVLAQSCDTVSGLIAISAQSCPDVNLARNELEGVLITHDLSKGSSLTIVCYYLGVDCTYTSTNPAAQVSGHSILPSNEQSSSCPNSITIQETYSPTPGSTPSPIYDPAAGSIKRNRKTLEDDQTKYQYHSDDDGVALSKRRVVRVRDDIMQGPAYQCPTTSELNSKGVTEGLVKELFGKGVEGVMSIGGRGTYDSYVCIYGTGGAASTGGLFCYYDMNGNPADPISPNPGCPTTLCPIPLPQGNLGGSSRRKKRAFDHPRYWENQVKVEKVRKRDL